MMMESDSRSSASRLDDETVAAVRAGLREYVANTANPAPLRSALETMAADALRKGMLPEQLVVLLKDLWGNLAEVRLLSDAGERVRMQQRVVTMCITEYFKS